MYLFIEICFFISIYIQISKLYFPYVYISDFFFDFKHLFYGFRYKKKIIIEI